MFEEAEYQQLKDSILNLGTVLPGTIRKVFLRCGKKNCRCQSNDKKQWHGPYSFWDRKDGKKLSSRSISPQQVKVLQGWINKRRELERIIRQMLKHGTSMAEGLKSSTSSERKSKKVRTKIEKNKLMSLLWAGLIAGSLTCMSVFSSMAQAADIQAQLDSNDGSSGFTIQNLAGAGKDKIDSNGNVGVGTTTSQTLLYVSPQGITPTYAMSPDAYIQNNLEVGGTAYFFNVQVDGMLTATGLHFSGQQSIDALTVSGNTYLAVTSGNVGIGTSTSASELTVDGGASIGTNLSYLNTLAPPNGLMVQGNVGIGSLAPGEALDVQGEVRTVNLAVSGQTPVSGYVLTASDSAGDTTWSSPGGVSGWTILGNNVYETGGGNVGIGTSTINQGALVVTNGNVGIGTWAPTGLLAVGANALTVNSAGSITTSGGYTQSGNNTNLLTGTTTFNAPGTSAEFVNYVGIGSTAPGQALDVQGTVRTTGLTMSGQTPVSGYVLTASDSAGDTTWTSPGQVGGWTVSGNNVFETSSGNVGIGTSTVNQGALVVTNGNVGIGTWAPTGLLAVGANALTVNSTGAIATTGGYTQSGVGTNTLTGTTTFNAAGTSAIFTSNVGIGSTAPGQALDVQGTVRTTGLTMSGQTPISGYVLTASDSSGDTTWTSPGQVGGWTVSGNNVFETSSGNVGIGTSTINQGALVVTNGNVGIGTWAPTGLLAVGANAFTVNSTGAIVTSGGYTQSGVGTNLLTGTTAFTSNVGIGSTVPGQALDVQGTVRTTGLAMSGQTPVSGYVLTASDSSGDTTWTSPGQVGGWTISGNDVYETSSGNVGIGTSTTTQGALVVTNGNVGIGTWAPTGLLAVGANALTVNSTGAITTTGGYTQSGVGTNTLTGTTTFSALGTSAIFTSNVGIGSTAPGQALDIQGTVRTTGLAMSGQTPVSGYILTASDSAGDTTWTTPGDVGGWTVSGNNVYETSSGNVGIGTFTVNQGALVVTNGNVGIGTWAPTGLLAVGANAFTVNSTGAIVTSGGYTQSGVGTNLLTGTTAFTSNVGIGSTVPGQALDIQGTVRTTGLAMSGQTPVSGYVLTASDSAGDTTWTTPGDVGGWTVSGNNVYETSSGNVGIGTSALQTAFAVTNGNVGIGTWTAAGGNLIVNGGGNVGIGSAWPGALLDVNGAIRTTTTGGVTFGTDNKAIIEPSATTTPDLRFLTNNTEIMRITNGGNVGIGSTIPGQLLDVQGTVRTTGLAMSGQTPVSGYILTASDSAGDTTWTTPGDVGGWTVSGNNVYETSSGNVGIGTSTVNQGALIVTNGNVGIGTWAPTGLLAVGANALTVNSTGAITTTGGYTQSGVGTNTLTGTTTFSALGTSAIFTSNVGIGSTVPGQALDVQGTVRTTGFTMSGQTPISGYVLSASDSAGDTTWTSLAAAGGWTVSGNNVYETSSGNVGIGTSALQTAFAVTNGNVGIGTWTAAGGNLIVNGGGNVGIGSAWPGALLDVNGAIRTTTTGGVTFGADNKAIIEPSATTTPDLRFLTNNTEIMRITNGGNVGIGSTVPGQKLDIQGTVRTTGFTMSGQTPISGYVLSASDSAGDTTWTSLAAAGGWTVSGNNVYETSSGNVGIGTSALQTAFAVTNGNVGIGTWTAGGGNLIVNGGGNVGIGTAWPGQLLDVHGTVRDLGEIVNGNVGIGTSALQAAFAVTNGNVGIGTWAPTGLLAVGANALTVNSAGSITTSGGYTQSGNNTNLLTGTTAFTSNVGIGSTAPGQALDVQGTVRTTGLTMSGQTPVSGYVLTASDSAGDTTWTTPGDVGGWTVSGNNVYETSSGNVGIGTSALQTAFAVTNGNVGIGTWTAGGGNLIVNGGGNVGIGTAWPGQLLDVHGTVRDLGEIVNGNVGIGTSALQAAFAVTNGNVGIGTWAPTGLLAVGANALTVNSAGSITTSGGYTQSGNNTNLLTGTTAFTSNVGIGSTAPGQALDVQGTVRTTGLTMSGQTPVSGYVLTASDSAGDTTWTTPGDVGGWTVSGNNVYETSSGNVGIGTSTVNQGALIVTNGNVGIGTWAPTGLLAVGANALTVNSNGAITTTGGYTQSGVGTNTLTGTTTFSALGTSAIFTSNVGIGSTAPGQALDVQGTVRTTGFTMSGQTPVSGYVLTASDSSGDTTWSSLAAAGGWTVSGNNVYETSSGNVGIGTSALQTAFAVTNGNVGIGTWTAGGGNLIVNGGGNVGIGSAWPGQLLDVQGTVRTTGFTMSGQTPISGYVLTASDSAGDTTWGSLAAAGGWTVSGNNVYETSSGNVGIGTSALQTAFAVTNGNVGIGTWTAGGGNLIVNGGGNVGIGTAWPGQSLDVQGTVRTIGEIVNGNVGIGTSALQTAFAVDNGNVGIGTWTSSSTLSIIGSIAVHTVTVTSGAYTAAANDQVIIINAAANVTINLPDLTTVPGREYIIKRTDSSAFTVTVVANGAQIIDGQTTVALTLQYQSYAIVSDVSGASPQWDIL